MTESTTAPQAPRVGFIGAGWTERTQIPAFKLGGLAIQAICANRPESAKRVAATHAIPEVYPSWRELLRAETVDVVSIATPPHLHAEIAIAALRAGKHVICEKPTALNVGEAEDMFAAAQAAPNQLAIIDHELRFQPPRVELRKRVRSGEIGSPLYVELDWLYATRLNPQAPWSWHSDADKGGGCLNSMGSHLFDLARWLFGRVDSLAAQLQTAHFLRPDPQTNVQRRVTSDDRAHMILQFGSGVQGKITANAMYPGNKGMSIVVVGTEGALRLDYEDRLWATKVAAPGPDDWEELPVADESLALPLPSRSPFAVGSYYLAKALTHTLQTNAHAIPDAATFYDGLVVQRALDAARRSHREKLWVRL
jgi:predicted dehydrogenase